MTYNIYARDPSHAFGKRMIGQVSSDDSGRAFIMAMRAVSSAYRTSGIKPEMFDCDPPFYAEPLVVEAG